MQPDDRLGVSPSIRDEGQQGSMRIGPRCAIPFSSPLWEKPHALDTRRGRMHGFAARTTGAMLKFAFKGRIMADSVYKVIELVGTSSESWEKAAAAAVELASKSLRDLRVAEVKELDVAIEDGRVSMYRAKLSVSFKYEGGD